ncbi:hypothetical protein [Corynebacterium flavescens]|uniref:hypothetical protein n=1 Tax=Corynebacterium flavescens TaxID=28028 RepID=UPI003FD4719E
MTSIIVIPPFSIEYPPGTDVVIRRWKVVANGKTWTAFQGQWHPHNAPSRRESIRIWDAHTDHDLDESSELYREIVAALASQGGRQPDPEELAISPS